MSNARDTAKNLKTGLNVAADGAIIDVQKNGTSVGTIGANGSNLYIGSPEGTDAYIGFGNNIVRPVTSAGASRDNAIDLGYTGMRFKDLYLSGGAYLGGTGSANHLDDYEEGTWTPTIQTGYSVSAYSVQYGAYTKIGNTVRAYFRFALQTASTTSSQVVIAGLPFTAVNAGHQYTTCTSYINTSSANGDSVKPLVFPNSAAVYLYYQSTTGVSSLVGTNLGSSLDILGQAVYQV